MIRFFPRVLCSVLVCCALPSVGLADYEVQIADYEWPSNFSVDEVLKIPQLRASLNHYEELDDAILIIRYPGGDEGYTWATALRDSLVSLGIRSAEMLLEPGSGVPATLVLIVSESPEF